MDKNIVSDLNYDRELEKLRKEGYKPFGEGVDFSKMSEKELQEYL